MGDIFTQNTLSAIKERVSGFIWAPVSVPVGVRLGGW